MAVHKLVAARGDEVAFFDGRNRFEAEIGRFRGAVVPDVATTKDLIAELERGAFDDRIQVRFSEDAVTIGRCETCGSPTDSYRDCVARQCGGRALLCAACAERPLCPVHR